ncbi:hypothetical protein [Cytobacillus gottheilii]|uniref:DUF4367 domain-containing protein n=1 Tax=Cytobacillus gottheilii TaxID=859144 RepID=A0ABX8FAZ2_9BACI|nr:hypothetical protein [Cytobacillus gottheilii]QVY60722.1 hypothetical protein J1899_17190 [Cytobacillus gottheilii]
MRKISVGSLLLLLSILFISGCSASLNEEESTITEAVKDAFQTSPENTNNENEDIAFYLPQGYEIEEETDNNVILNNGNKTYILFYNQNEASDSKVVYDSTINQGDYEVNETFEKEDGFGFLLIKEAEEKLNEMTVGIGGVKLTTQVKTSELSETASSMMEIAQSVAVK